MRSRKSETEKITLTDRLAFAFFGAASSFITGALVYVVVAYVVGELGHAAVPAFYPVYIFTAFMSALGFITANDYIFKILMGLWRLLFKVGQTGGP